MPTKVERSYSGMNSPHHHDHATRNNANHKEALRLALGSILAPKRPLTPMSRSSSGSATPAFESSHAASLGWPQLAVADSAHPHLRPGCSSLPHTHSHSPSAHPQTTPPAVHPPQTTHPHHLHPLSSHLSHPSSLSRPDLTSSTSSPSPPQHPQSQSLPPSLPHSLPHSPSHGHPLTPTHTLASSMSPEHPSIPGDVTSTSPSMPHSPTLGPPSIPEEQPLQMLPPLVAAGSGAKTPKEYKGIQDGEFRDVAPPAQTAHPRPRSHPLQTMPGGTLSPEMGGSKSEQCMQAQRAGFIQTLQSKNSAWEALIHGSFT